MLYSDGACSYMSGKRGEVKHQLNATFYNCGQARFGKGQKESIQEKCTGLTTFVSLSASGGDLEHFLPSRFA